MVKSKSTYLLIAVFVIPLIVLIGCSNTKHFPVEKAFHDKTAIAPATPDKKAISAKMMNLQIPFIENQGQMADEVRYYANTFAGNVYVTEKGEIVYGLIKNEGEKEEATSKGIVLKETLVGGKINTPYGKDSAVTKINYFTGSDKSKWQSNISTFNVVNLGEVYDGIELNLKAHGDNVEKLFTVSPSGSVDNIKLNLDGAKSLSVNDKGELEIETELGKVKLTKPYAYQDIDGKKVEVKSVYVIMDNSKSYGFQVASYDKDYPLVIDPLLASTFVGGSDSDLGRDIAFDSLGNVYVIGNTYSDDFPITTGAYDASIDSIPSNGDVVVSKSDSNLSTLLASTFIGGSANEEGRLIKIDSTGKVFILGWTTSEDYPSTSGAYSETKNQFEDNYVSCLNSDLSSLLASTFIGGNNTEYSFALNIDSSDNIYIAGETYSADYPTTSGCYDSSLNDDISQSSRGDCFVSKLNNSLSSLLASTFIGGNYQEMTRALTTDNDGNVYITGGTSSTDFPATAGAYDTISNSTDPFIFNVFVSKFDGNLGSLLASTYIGNNCGAYGLDVDSSGNVFISGVAYSYGGSYPVTAGAYDTNSSSADAFASKLSGDLTTLLASTFIGGGNIEYCFGLAVDSNDDVFIAGDTNSSDYPTTNNSYDSSYNGGQDLFISKLDNNLSALLASTFIGSSGDDHISDISLNSSGNVFITGMTGPSNYPTTSGAYDTSGNGSADTFVSKFDNNLSADNPTAITLSSFNAKQRGKKVLIKWKTASEIDNLGFNILRSDSENGTYTQINGDLIKKKKKAVSGAKYKLKDRNITKGNNYWYKLEDIDSNTGSTLHDAVEVKVKGKAFKKKHKK